MKHLFLRLALLLLLPSLASAEAQSWVSFDVPAAEEEAALAALAHRQIDAIGWTNAVVDVSDFGPLRLLPLDELDRVLTDQDPRKDPWLAGIGASFHPKDGVTRLWVDAGSRDQAAEALGSLVQDSGHAAEVTQAAAPVPKGHREGELFTPRQVTASLLLLSCFMLLVFRLAAREDWRRFIAPGAGLVLGLAVLLVPRSAAVPIHEVSRSAAPSEVSWLRHRWFQESYPWGATWKDWTPGRPWTYPSYERKDGRVAAVQVTLPAPDQTWADAAYASLDPHHAALIFPRENP